MKKVSCIAIIAMVMACPAFADIAANNNNPTCDSTTIGATSGDTALDATWNANTLNLKWMANGSQYSSNTCTYGQKINIPSGTPTKTGYTFAGWRLSTGGGNSGGATYTACRQITNQTTCNEYIDHGCKWWYNECIIDSGDGGYKLAPSQSWCEDNDNKLYWNNNTCNCNGICGATIGFRTCGSLTHELSCNYNDDCTWDSENNYCVTDPSAYGESCDIEDMRYYMEIVDINPEGPLVGSGDLAWGRFPENGYGVRYEIQPNEYVVLIGEGVCSKNTGTNNNQTWSAPTVYTNLKNETGEHGAKYCYCNILAETSYPEQSCSISSPYVFVEEFSDSEYCQTGCAEACGDTLHSNSDFRGYLFGQFEQE